MKRILLALSLLLFLILIFFSGCISQSCDDSNSCTKDDGGIAGLYCSHSSLDGNQPGCDSLVPPCRQQSCIAGSCKITNISKCCGNGKCEANEDLGNCAADCEGSTDIDCNATSPLVPILLKMQDSLDAEFVSCVITNNAERKQDIVFSAEIPGWTNNYSQSFPLFPGESKEIPIRFDWKEKFYINRESSDASILFKAESSGVTVASATQNVKISPKEDIFWTVQMDSKDIPLYRSVVAWVTPHDKCVQSLISSAKELSPGRSLGGYTGYEGLTEEERTNKTLAQAKAIFYAIKGQGISYVNTPVSFSGSQHVKMPADSLNEKSGNCVDGSVLFASAFESLGMNPVLLILPAHMFVGVETYPKSGHYVFIETTIVGTSSFEDAVVQGNEKFNEFQSTDNLSVIDVTSIRSEITPFPSYTNCLLNATCSDGTLAGHCSITRPKLCTGTGFIDAATVCGCDSGYEAIGDECVSTIVKNETFVLGHSPTNKYFFWSPGYINEEFITFRYIVRSDEPLDIRVFPSRGDFELFSSGSSYNHYPSYMATNTLFYDQIAIHKSKGGVGLENVGESDAQVNILVMRTG